MWPNESGYGSIVPPFPNDFEPPILSGVMDGSVHRQGNGRRQRSDGIGVQGGRLLRTVFGIVAVIVVTVLLALGGLAVLEIGFRATGAAARGSVADFQVFPYAPYYLSTQPANFALRKGDPPNIFNNYFVHNECDAPDGVAVRFNSDGFRSPEFHDIPPKSPNEIRVIITGGSTAVSWNVGENCTLDSNLRRELEKRYPGKTVRVFNMASAAWISLQELIAVQIHGLPLQPDVVIAFDGFNDIEHSYSIAVGQAYNDFWIRAAFNQYRDWLGAGVANLFMELRLPSVLLSRLKPRGNQIVGSGTAATELPDTAVAAKPGGLATKLRWPLDLDAIAKRTDFDPLNGTAVDTYLRNERTLVRAVGGGGGKVLLALQPTLFLKDTLSQTERDVILPMYTGTVNYVVQGYLRMKVGLADLARSEPNARFVDLSNAFAGDGTHIFGDYAHLTAAAYATLARRLADEMAPLLVNASTPTSR